MQLGPSPPPRAACADLRPLRQAVEPVRPSFLHRRTALRRDGSVLQTMRSGLPSGWAACDHSAKNGLRTSSTPAGVRLAMR